MVIVRHGWNFDELLENIWVCFISIRIDPLIKLGVSCTLCWNCFCWTHYYMYRSIPRWLESIRRYLLYLPFSWYSFFVLFLSLVQPKGQIPDYTAPVVLHDSSPSIEDFCMRIHKQMLSQLKYAWVWGSSVRHQPQKVLSNRDNHFRFSRFPFFFTFCVRTY